MRLLIWSVCCRRVASVMFGAAVAGCIDAPPDPGPRVGVARLVVSWDPLVCGEPHRVAIDLADDAGAEVSGSTPCSLGGLAIDLPHLGSYRGQIYAWALAAPMRSVAPIEVDVDQTIVRREVATPP
jgi:hypothetical protein